MQILPPHISAVRPDYYYEKTIIHHPPPSASGLSVVAEE